jgi:hypothetical protein
VLEFGNAPIVMADIQQLSLFRNAYVSNYFRDVFWKAGQRQRDQIDTPRLGFFKQSSAG